MIEAQSPNLAHRLGRTMKWMLVERKPGVVYSAGTNTYLGKNNAEIKDVGLALTFETRAAAEAHRRTLKQRYQWVAVSFPD
jgi:hypothetical protein